MQAGSGFKPALHDELGASLLARSHNGSMKARRMGLMRFGKLLY